MPRRPIFDPIEFLVLCKFPEARSDSIDGHFRRQSRPGWPELQRQMEEYRNELRELPEEEIATRVAQEKQKVIDQERKLDELRERQLFFNRPEAMADFEFWAKQAFWHCDEAVALSLGRNPEVVTFNKIHAFSKTSPLAAEYDRLYSLLHRAQLAGQLYERIAPAEFLSWALQYELTIPAELKVAIERRTAAAVDWKRKYEELKVRTDALLADAEARASMDETTIAALRESESAMRAQLEMLSSRPANTDSKSKPFDSRERTTALKMIIGMAIGGYKYDPSAAKSTVTGEIKSDLELNGVALGEDAIRKYLKAGAELLPGDIAPRK